MFLPAITSVHIITKNARSDILLELLGASLSHKNLKNKPLADSQQPHLSFIKKLLSFLKHQSTHKTAMRKIFTSYWYKHIYFFINHIFISADASLTNIPLRQIC